MEQRGSRPAIDVVVPFAGSDESLREAAQSLAAMRLGAGDTLTVVDNRPGGPGGDPREVEGVRVVRAPERQSSYFARNRGAGLGVAEWLLFIDADVRPAPDLLDRYFDRQPGERTAVLAGGIADVEAGSSTAVGRFLTRSSSMSQANTLRGDWPYAQTANCAVRRSAFDEVGGFTDTIRSGGDADLCFRLRAAGWELETRDEAVVEHVARTTVRALAAQRLRHGSGSAWLDRAYPGSFPAASLPGLVKWTALELGRALVRGARGDRDGAAAAGLDLITFWAMQVGRLRSNVVGGSGS